MKRYCLLVLLILSAWLLSCNKKQIQSKDVAAAADVSIVTTFAGDGSLGAVDGLKGNASFYGPMDIAIDGAGDFYVTDRNTIRKISATGVVSTLSGKYESGSVDGVGTNAMFNNPRGLTIDASGNIYIADYGNNKIRKITPDGVVSTLAGSGAIGSTDGQGTAATFQLPFGITIDASGNLYVADTYNHKIRKVSPSGNVTTLAGSTSGLANGPLATASFSAPYSIATDASGNLYVADISETIRKISSGIVSTFAGSPIKGPLDGTGAETPFMGLSKVITDAAGNLYVSDGVGNKIRKITPQGVVTTLAGTGTAGFTNGPGSKATFNGPLGMAVDAAGNVYVTEPYNRVIRKITPIKP